VLSPAGGQGYSDVLPGSLVLSLARGLTAQPHPTLLKHCPPLLLRTHRQAPQLTGDTHKKEIEIVYVHIHVHLTGFISKLSKLFQGFDAKTEQDHLLRTDCLAIYLYFFLSNHF
jgi:hypothetical protein